MIVSLHQSLWEEEVHSPTTWFDSVLSVEHTHPEVGEVVFDTFRETVILKLFF